MIASLNSVAMITCQMPVTNSPRYREQSKSQLKFRRHFVQSQKVFAVNIYLAFSEVSPRSRLSLAAIRIHHAFGAFHILD